MGRAGGVGPMWGKQAVRTKHLGVTWWREGHPWPEGSSAGEGSLVSFWGPLGVHLERGGLEDDAPGMTWGLIWKTLKHTCTVICMHTQAHKHTHTCAQAWRHSYTCTGPQAHVHAGLCTCAHAFGNTHTPQAMHVHDSARLYTGMHTHAHTCTHIHAYL